MSCMASKLLSICIISKDHSREQIGCGNGQVLEKSTPIANGSPITTIVGRPLDGIGLEANPYHRWWASGGKYTFVILGGILLFKLVFSSFIQGLNGYFEPLINRLVRVRTWPINTPL
ncbi:hypothetical protein M9H77_27323 [Catharanthus roseus]|uniref:Uncharacterized protein n=1 Tax=Catharanthus roseus TaxID=4058 RepID=A0ACC0ADT3_CATRO|nr:hypothetical protein M9H77_27323 [Catharanthus roseus]